MLNPVQSAFFTCGEAGRSTFHFIHIIMGDIWLAVVLAVVLALPVVLAIAVLLAVVKAVG